MAKKYEFKPDKIRSGILGKLYMTPRQRAMLLKWGLYALVLVLLSVLQDVVLCRLRIMGATTELLPCAIFLICIMEGSHKGCIFTLAASFGYYFSGSAPIYGPVLITVLAVVVCIFREAYLQEGVVATLMGTAIAMVLYELGTFGVGLFLGLTIVSRLTGFLLTAGLSLLAFPILYPVLRSIRTIGGEAWNE